MKLIFSVNVTLPKKSVHDHALVHRLKHSTVLTLRTDFLDCCVYMVIPVCSLEHRIASQEMPICLSCPFTLTNRLLRRENISFPSLKVLTHLKGLSSSSHYVLNNITRFISFFPNITDEIKHHTAVFRFPDRDCRQSTAGVKCDCLCKFGH